MMSWEAWEDLGGPGRSWEDLGCLGRSWEVIYEKLWEVLGGSWQVMAGHGRSREYMERHGRSC